ncbi:TonB-dependent receptor [soil metagenome]
MPDFRFTTSRVRATARAVLLVLITVLWAAPGLASQSAAGPGAIVSGRVADEAAAPLSGAFVTLLDATGSEPLRTTLTAADGGFRLLAVPPGRYRIRAAFLGYATGEREIALAAGQRARVDFELRVAALRVREIEVRARRDTNRERVRFEADPGVTARVVGGEELKILPGLAEADVLRAIELLPGVVSTSDFSSAFNVRGGSADQNLILLDGFPIFNPFHLGGLFSVFNSDVVARAELLAGGFGAEYGGRVSSVLNVESRVDTASTGVRAQGGVSLLASRLALSSQLPSAVAGALGGEAGGWTLSARRSYFDQILRPVFDFPYHLTDLQGHAWIGTAGGGRLRFTGYTGDDVLDLTDFTPPGDDDTSILRIRWRWGNDVVGAHWQQPLGGVWLADTRLGFSRYRDALVFADFDDTRFSSRIAQLSLRSDLARDFSRTSLRTGLELSRIRYSNLAEAGGTEFASSADRGVLGATYLSTRWRPAEAWLLEGGLRFDGWWAQDTTRATLSPRLAAKRFLGSERDAAIKLAAGRYTQFLHSLRNEEFPLSNDIWVVADRSVPHVVSDQVQLGVEKFWGDTWFASVEGYARTFNGVTEFNPADDPDDPDDDLLAGRGVSRGVDFFLRRTAGPLQGWATVSLLWAERTFPDPLAAQWSDLPSEVSFPPFWDRRANINVVLQYELPRGVETGVRWNYGSGLPYTRPVAQHAVWAYDPGGGRYRAPTSARRGIDAERLFVVLGDRNVHRYPAYHRLDATVRRSFQPRWGTLTPYLQVLNVYNRQNVLFYFYNFDRTPPTRSGLSMFPILPTIGLEASF